MNRYYYSKNGADVQGPVTEDDLKQMYAAGIVTTGTQLCREGADSWHPIQEILPLPPLPPRSFTTPSSIPFSPKGYDPKNLSTGYVIFFLAIGIITIIVLAINSGRSTPSNSASTYSPATSAPSAPSARQTGETLSYISWDTIDEIYNLKSKYTDLQKDQEWIRFKGKRVKWSGTVKAISQSFGSLTMQVKMNPTTFTSDVIVTLKDSEKSKAGRLREGDSVRFIATLNRWSTLMPISMNNGEITD